MKEIRNQMSDVRRQKSGIRCQTSEYRSQESDIKRLANTKGYKNFLDESYRISH